MMTMLAMEFPKIGCGNTRENTRGLNLECVQVLIYLGVIFNILGQLGFVLIRILTNQEFSFLFELGLF